MYTKKFMSIVMKNTLIMMKMWGKQCYEKIKLKSKKLRSIVKRNNIIMKRI